MTEPDDIRTAEAAAIRAAYARRQAAATHATLGSHRRPDPRGRGVGRVLPSMAPRLFGAVEWHHSGRTVC